MIKEQQKEQKFSDARGTQNLPDTLVTREVQGQSKRRKELF